ncbi:hypothetical protein CFC21_048437 [Triticum aestivum]|uniref:Uncharacterized protein n=2 Tax=Triticum aestivum TaxID=4565 RepID=A0A9R1K2A0_WHEAT|nr:hypothetical protein CFC21_048437 [Triticum aestivum]
MSARGPRVRARGRVGRTATLIQTSVIFGLVDALEAFFGLDVASLCTCTCTGGVPGTRLSSAPSVSQHVEDKVG